MIIMEADYIEHFGVKGQRWGVRNPQNRALNKASRSKDRAKAVKQIEKARANVKSGKQKEELRTAKEKFHSDKEKVGSREARKILNKTKQKHWNERQVANTAKDGGEIAKALLATFAGAIAIGALSGALKQ